MVRYAPRVELARQADVARPAAVHKGVFAGGAASTDWIDIEFYAGNRIYFPAKVNGHDVVVLLDSGAETSAIDRERKQG